VTEGAGACDGARPSQHRIMSLGRGSAWFQCPGSLRFRRPNALAGCIADSGEVAGRVLAPAQLSSGGVPCEGA
jgi:hypothetical protein